MTASRLRQRRLRYHQQHRHWRRGGDLLGVVNCGAKRLRLGAARVRCLRSNVRRKICSPSAPPPPPQPPAHRAPRLLVRRASPIDWSEPPLPPLPPQRKPALAFPAVAKWEIFLASRTTRTQDWSDGPRCYGNGIDFSPQNVQIHQRRQPCRSAPVIVAADWGADPCAETAWTRRLRPLPPMPEAHLPLTCQIVPERPPSHCGSTDWELALSPSFAPIGPVSRQVKGIRSCVGGCGDIRRRCRRFRKPGRQKTAPVAGVAEPEEEPTAQVCQQFNQILTCYQPFSHFGQLVLVTALRPDDLADSSAPVQSGNSGSTHDSAVSVGDNADSQQFDPVADDDSGVNNGDCADCRSEEGFFTGMPPSDAGCQLVTSNGETAAAVVAAASWESVETLNCRELTPSFDTHPRRRRRCRLGLIRLIGRHC
ncbi:hypothetical protein BOX15_Mlig014476g1 [Macrostomum lignano]|nr:hypothetical protein BOX15_Mlig014476g1 [Macrostomum lignano]